MGFPTRVCGFPRGFLFKVWGFLGFPQGFLRVSPSFLVFCMVSLRSQVVVVVVIGVVIGVVLVVVVGVVVGFPTRVCGFFSGFPFLRFGVSLGFLRVSCGFPRVSLYSVRFP